MSASRCTALILIAIIAAMSGRAALAEPPARPPETAKPPDLNIVTPAPTPIEKDEMALPPPIAFFIAKGEPDICGPGCNSWIAADGAIDRAAPQRLRALLGRLGKRKLPIYFHSPGGSVTAAMEIGRLMRARAMTAGVARTLPLGCDLLQQREAACDALKRSGSELPSDLRTQKTMCNSSCVYALIGAAVHEVAAGAALGIHTIALAKLDKHGLRKPDALAAPQPGDAVKLRAAEQELAQYAAAMGVSRALVEAATAVAYDKIRFVSRDEIARFGIDRRDFHESRWMTDEQSSGKASVTKFFVEAKAGEPKQYRTTLIRLSCAADKRILVQMGRELASFDKPVSMAFTARTRDFVLPPDRRKPTQGSNGLQIEHRFAWMPPAFFLEAALSDTIDLSEAPDISALDKPSHRIRLSTAGLVASFAALNQTCR